MQFYIEANIGTGNAVQIMLHAYAYGILSGVEREAAVIAGNLADGDAGFVCHPHYHFIAGFINSKSKYVETTNHIGYGGRCEDVNYPTSA